MDLTTIQEYDNLHTMDTKMDKKQLDNRLTVLVPSGLKLKAQTKALQERTNLSRLVRLWLTEYIIASYKGENDGSHP